MKASQLALLLVSVALATATNAAPGEHVDVVPCAVGGSFYDARRKLMR